MKSQYLVWGKVIAGSKRGKNFGFPTANISLHKQIPDGVYIAEVKINHEMHSALTFVGAAKTFGEKKKKVESYIFNFNKNIYNRWITVSLLKKIRGNIRFNSEKELTEQIKKDLIIANKLFKE